MQLYESERKVMEILWQEGRLCARDIAQKLLTLAGWQRTTTYTVIKKCAEKGYLRREEPGFWCTPLLSREDNLLAETRDFLETHCGGDANKMVAFLLEKGLLGREKLRILTQ